MAEIEFMKFLGKVYMIPFLKLTRSAKLYRFCKQHFTHFLSLYCLESIKSFIKLTF